MNNWTMADIISAFNEALCCSDCPNDMEQWLDDNVSNDNVPNFVWMAVRALSKYDESLKQEG